MGTGDGASLFRGGRGAFSKSRGVSSRQISEAFDRVSFPGRRTVLLPHPALPPEGGPWRDGRVSTDRGIIGARTILLCTHFPFLDKPGWYFARIWQQRTYLLALKGTPVYRGMYIGYEKEDDAYTFRSCMGPDGPLLLFGGRAHKTGHEGDADHFGRLQQAAFQLLSGGGSRMAVVGARLYDA